MRRTLSLGAVDQDVAAAKAASLFSKIQQHGWPALGQREGSIRPSVVAAPDEADPHESLDYWRLRLVERKYPATSDAKPELSCRIEHDGTGCYFPLGTLNEAQAAERALRIFNCVIGEGWETAVARHRCELTMALFWLSLIHI